MRTLFAYAARFACSCRSVDWVAAYLQGELLEGEVVYCHMPAGYEKEGMILMIIKPIYMAYPKPVGASNAPYTHGYVARGSPS